MREGAFGESFEQRESKRMAINWNAGARLMKLEPHSDGFFRGRPVQDGTLGTTIRKYLEAPDDEKSAYSILVGEEAGTGATILQSKKIDELASMADYQKQLGR
jgi:hypothetical protein